MSAADDIRARLATALQQGTKLAQFTELKRIGHWKDAAKLAADLGGSMPRGQIVSLNARRATNQNGVSIT